MGVHREWPSGADDGRPKKIIKMMKNNAGRFIPIVLQYPGLHVGAGWAALSAGEWEIGDDMFLTPEDRQRLDNSKRANILRLLDDGLTVRSICQQLHVSTKLVCKVKRLYFQEGLSAALGIQEYPKLHPYILGILWAIGYYDSLDGIFILRHQNPYFLKKVRDAVGSGAAVRKQGKHYIVKLASYCFDIEQLRQLGWTERNSHERPYPNINEHQDFIRGYFEIHGRVSKVRLHNKKGGIQIQNRLRIYGNETFLQGVNEIISFELGIPEKRLESTQKEHSKVLGYYKLPEIIDILDWLYESSYEDWKNAELEKEYREILK